MGAIGTQSEPVQSPHAEAMAAPAVQVGSINPRRLMNCVPA